MYVGILDQQGEVVLRHYIDTNSNILLEMAQPFKEDLIVGVECMFTGYWLADLQAGRTSPNFSSVQVALASKFLLI